MSATLDGTLADPKDHITADLQRQLAASNVERDEALAERDEALARETATSEVLQVINFSPGDLAPVFDAILEKAHSLCGVAYGTLQLHDGRHCRAVAQRGNPEPLAELLRQPYVAEPNSGAGRLIAG